MFIRLLLSLLLLISTDALASPPQRQNSYVPGAVISASDVSENENVIFNYLQAGIDTIADNTVVNADIATNANIQSDKINLTAIAQNIANTGTFTNTGAVSITGNTTITGNLTVTGSTTTGSLNTLPSGVIIMWNSTVASIPSGWVLCNGSNGTPDLRNRFIVAADADSGGAAKSTITGSAAQSGGSTTISQANLPSYNLSFTRYDANGSGLTGVQGTTNGATASSQTVASGGSGTAYTQPFYALCYIQKT